MTQDEKSVLYDKTINRLRRCGVNTRSNIDVVVALTNEIDRYREKIDSLETTMKEMQAVIAEDCAERIDKNAEIKKLRAKVEGLRRMKGIDETDIVSECPSITLKIASNCGLSINILKEEK